MLSRFFKQVQLAVPQGTGAALLFRGEHEIQ